MGVGTVLHVNTVGLMAAVEENLETSLRGRPFVIANEGAPRAVVLDLSPKAHQEGLRSGMSLALARNRVSDLLVRAPRPDLCLWADNTLCRICRVYTPLVEPAGRGHVFVDLVGTTGINGPPEDAAQKIRKCIQEETGLRPVLALAGSKTVSKVATRVFRPAGFIALTPHEENLLLRRQPVELLPGVGPVLLGRFGLLGIDEIGDLAELSDLEARALGPRVLELVARSRGIDVSPVDPEPPMRRVTRGEVLFEPDVMDPEIIRVRLEALVADLAFSLRKEGLGARRVRVGIFYTDKTHTEASARSVRLMVRDDELSSFAKKALERARARRVRIRRLTLELSEQEAAGPELDLFEPAEERRSRLQVALDTVKSRYGLSAIGPAALLAVSSGAAS